MLQDIFKQLELPQDANDWLCDLYACIQVFDDIADGDEVNRKDLNHCIWSSLVGMNVNSFFKANSISLLPVMATAIFKWQGSDTAERKGQVDERSFMWRASFYDVVMITYFICHGRELAEENAAIIMNLYGENYQEYKEEFNA